MLMVHPGNLSIERAEKITGLRADTITRLSVCGLFPPVLHYPDGAQINAGELRSTIKARRWRGIIASRFMTPEEATLHGLVTNGETLAFRVGRREYHDTEQALRATADYLMDRARTRPTSCQKVGA